MWKKFQNCRREVDMADPFQDVDAAGEEFISAFADSMDERQSDPTMEKIVSKYLGKLEFSEDSLTVEVGCGAGAVTRRIAEKAHPGRVIGFEPSVGFVNEAKARVGGYDNVEFEVADGASLPLDEGAVDTLIMHTVLTHVEDPAPLLTEARRVLKSGGFMVVCDADFSKASLGNMPNDPLDACAKVFVSEFVTDPYAVAKLQRLATNAGFSVQDFSFQSRSVLDNDQMLPWVEETGKVLMKRGEIGEALHNGLVAEYRRRAREGTLHGYQVFATLIAKRP
jgi:ubiquinone/menaquinone biosynthesis C-methylase UbiE